MVARTVLFNVIIDTYRDRKLSLLGLPFEFGCPVFTFSFMYTDCEWRFESELFLKPSRYGERFHRIMKVLLWQERKVGLPLLVLLCIRAIPNKNCLSSFTAVTGTTIFFPSFFISGSSPRIKVCFESLQTIKVNRLSTFFLRDSWVQYFVYSGGSSRWHPRLGEKWHN